MTSFRDDFQNVRRFMEHLAAAKTTDTHAPVVAQLAEADALLQTTYSDWLAMDLVGGRVHTLERDLRVRAAQHAHR